MCCIYKNTTLSFFLQVFYYICLKDCEVFSQSDVVRNIPKKQMKSTIEKLINHLNSGYEIIMESDLVSLLFYCFVTENPESINKTHSDTRVFNSDGLHIDLVIGQITLESKRPSIIPELLIE